MPTECCLNCGAELEVIPQKRKKLYCDSTCRSNYWQKADRLEKAGKSTEEIVSLMQKLAANNKNKKRISKEREGLRSKVKFSNPLDKTDAYNGEKLNRYPMDEVGLTAPSDTPTIKERIEQLKKELNNCPKDYSETGRIMWRKEREKKIKELQLLLR